MPKAIAREKQIKDSSRKKKFDLINSKNPEWKDLYASSLLDSPRLFRHCEPPFFGGEAIL